MAKHGLVNIGRLDAAPFEGGAGGNGPKFRRMSVPKGATISADRCASSAHDDDFGNRHSRNTIKQLLNSGILRRGPLRPTIHPVGFKIADLCDEMRCDSRKTLRTVIYFASPTGHTTCLGWAVGRNAFRPFPARTDVGLPGALDRWPCSLLSGG